jgi:molybdate transport system substrate-binding protein
MRQDHSTRGIVRRGAVVIVLVLGWWSTACAERPPVVAAASDLQFALSESAGRFARERGQQVEVVFGSSGTLTRQLRDGAPFELFLSADEKFVEELADAGLTRDRGVRYATGRLALFAPTGSPLVPGEGLGGLARLIAAGRVTRFAIANPEHAPYGRAAEAALRKHGLWNDLQPSLVLGDNVSQAAQFATSGNAVGGIIAHSLALAPNVQSRGTFALIPDTDHPPLLQRMVLLNRATLAAEQFYRYLQEPAARSIFEQYGFTLPNR